MRVAFVWFRAKEERESPSDRRMRRTIRLLGDAGHEVVVLCPKWWDGSDHEVEVDDVTYRAVTADRAEGTFATKLPGALRRVRPDVIHAQSDPPSAVLAASLGSSVTRAPLVVDWYEHRSGSGRLLRRAATAGDAVVVPSRTVKTHVREIGVAGGDITVIPDPVDLDLICETDPEEPVDVVFSRRLDDDANAGILFLALAEIRDREWTAVVVGDGPERETYERQARDLRIDDRVDFRGTLSIDERVALFKGAHVFVQTATREAFARDLLWALACGCVGVVEYQALSSAHELIEQRQRGFRTTSDSELTDRILQARSLPRRGFNEAFEGFDRERIAERYVDCYRELVDDGGLF